MKRMLYLAATVCMLFASCTKGTENTTPEPEVAKIPINLSIGKWTRANDATFDSGDKVGIYVVNYNGSTAGTLAVSGNHVDNMLFTYGGGKWTPAEDIYWKDQTTKTDIYAYYPYGTPDNIRSYAFDVEADQSAEASYWASDFLWGKATGVSPTESAVPVTTHHSFSNALIYVVPGDGFDAEDLADANIEVKLCNVKTGATIDLTTGVATVTGSATEITPWYTGEYYRAMVVPQTVADGKNLVTVKANGVTYTYAKGMTFKANTQHKLTITVNKTSNGVNVGIGGWESDDEDYGGSAE